MDRVRFGRALGYGARHAAKAMMEAVNAAGTPSPAATKPQVDVRRRVAAAPDKVRRARQQAKVAGKTVWTPLVKFSSVLWLQVTGSFFLLLAAAFAGGVWKTRGALHLPGASHEAERLYVYAAAFAVFAYFGVSNFVRAWRRDRAKF